MLTIPKYPDPVNFLLYGKAPYQVALLHGGPGAWGEMAPVANFLAGEFACIECFQTKSTLDGQIEEIAGVISKVGHPPVILVGFSWGAWLAYICAADPKIQKLINCIVLIGCGPLTPEYFSQLQQTRNDRLLEKFREKEQIFYQNFEKQIQSAESIEEREKIISKLGKITERTDQWDILSETEKNTADSTSYSPEFDIDRSQFFEQALVEVQSMRKSGRLVELAQFIHCPVYILHGSYDPHPAAGVINPLKSVLSDMHVTIFESCGHKPWIEKSARSDFLKRLKAIIHRQLV